METTAFGVNKDLEEKLEALYEVRRKKLTTDPNLEISPLRVEDEEYHIYIGNAMEKISLVASNTRVTRSRNLNLQQLFNCIKEEGTYKFIHPKQWCLKILDNELNWPKRLRLHHIDKYFCQVTKEHLGKTIYG
mmetsp:Transcript_19003/g.28895  ORF Transcript_19003/g.28895 Transcript_19003/m.28895 type:complete len:133 (+) Transcript_19003:552-950(+)